MANSHESSPAAPPADPAEVVPAASTDPGMSNETTPPTVDSATGGGETSPDPAVNNEPQKKESFRIRMARTLSRLAGALEASQERSDQKKAAKEQAARDAALQRERDEWTDGTFGVQDDPYEAMYAEHYSKELQSARKKDKQKNQDTGESMKERALNVARGIGSIASRIKDRLASSWLFTEAKRIVSEEIEDAKKKWHEATERKKKRKEEREKRRKEAREKREAREKELREQLEQQRQQAELAKQEALRRKAERKAKRGKNIEKVKSAVRTAYEKSARAVGATIGGIVVFGDRVKHAVEAAKIAWQEYGKETSDSNAETDVDTDPETDTDAEDDVDEDSSTDPENPAA